VIQSRSPRSSLTSFLGSVRLLCAASVEAGPGGPTRVLGRSAAATGVKHLQEDRSSLILSKSENRLIL